MAPSHVAPRLSVAERMSMIAKLPLISTRILVEFLRRRSMQPKLSAKLTAFLALAQTITVSLSLRQLQFLVPPTGTMVAKRSKKHGFPLTSVELATGDGFPPATLHLVSLDPQAPSAPAAGQPTLLYIHGGGYVFSMSDGHFEFAVVAARAAGATTLALLEYTLAPAHAYPTQMAQGAAALRYLLGECKLNASDVVVGGDSAGASISLGVLSHAVAPHARIAPLPAGLLKEPGQKLKGVFLISPACSLDYTSGSYTSNAAKDYITTAAMDVFVGAFRPTKGEVWAKPLAGDSQYWAAVGAERVLLVAGADEVFRDDVVKLAGIMRGGAAGDERVALEVVPGELHAQSVIDYGIGIQNGKMTAAILGWLRSL